MSTTKLLLTALDYDFLFITECSSRDAKIFQPTPFPTQSISKICTKYSSYKIRKTQNYHRLSKLDRPVVVNLKPISYFFCIYLLIIWSRPYWSKLNYPLVLANIWEEAISILAENLNLGRRSYLTTTVNYHLQLLIWFLVI